MWNEMNNLKKELAIVGATASSTANAVRKNGVSYKSAKAAYGGGRKIWNNSKALRKNGKRARASIMRGKRPPRRRKQNAVEKSTNVMKHELAKHVGGPTYRNHLAVRGNRAGRDRFKKENTTRGCLMAHSELIESVYATENIWTQVAIPVAPSVDELNPFAANTARQYAKVKIVAIKITYTGTCGTGTDGRIWMGFDPSADNFDVDKYDTAEGFAQLDNAPPEGGCPVWGSTEFEIDVLHFAKGTDKMLTNFAGNVESLGSNQEQFLGGYFVYAVDSPALGAVGQLMISYVYDFCNAKLPTPISDFWTATDLTLEWSDMLNVWQYFTNVSKAPITTLADPPDTDDQKTFLVSVTNNYTLSLRVTGTNFPSAVDGSTHQGFIYYPAISDGSFVGLYTVMISATEQYSTWNVEAIDNALIYLETIVEDTDPSFQINVVQVTISPNSVDITDSTPADTPRPKTVQFRYKPRQLCQMIQQYKSTGKPSPSRVMPDSGRNRQKYYFVDYNEKNKTRAIASGETKEETKENDDDSISVASAPAPGKRQNDWKHHLLGNKGMHASNGNGLLGLVFLFLVLCVSSQMPPYYTTTRHPTSNPNTPRPTKKPTVIPIRYSLIVFDSGVFTEYFDSSDAPLLTVYNSTTLRYNSYYGYPMNISITLMVTGVSNGYFQFAGTGTDSHVSGRNAVYNERQIGWYFWRLKDASDKLITLKPATAFSDSVGQLMATPVNDYPSFGIQAISGPTLNPTTAAPITMIRV